MLKKLFKYEWKSVSTLLLIVHGALLVYALIGRIGYQIYFSKFLSDSSNPEYVDNHVLCGRLRIRDHGSPAYDHAVSGNTHTEKFLFR